MINILKSRGPCICGAEDCPKCHPECFDKNGRYMDDENYDPEDDGDDGDGDDEEDYGDWENEEDERDNNGNSFNSNVAAREFGGMDISDSRY